MAPGKVQVRPAKVTVRLALATLAHGQKGITLALLEMRLAGEAKRESVDLVVPETQVATVAVMALLHPVMLSRHTLLLREGHAGRLAMFGTLVLVQNPV